MKTVLEQKLELHFPELKPRFYVHEREKIPFPCIRPRNFCDIARWAFAMDDPSVTEDDIDEVHGASWLPALYRRLTAQHNGYFLEYEVDSTSLGEGKTTDTSRAGIQEIIRKGEYEEKVRVFYNEMFMLHAGTVKEDPRKGARTVVGLKVNQQGKVIETWGYTLDIPQDRMEQFDAALIYKGQEQAVQSLLQLQDTAADYEKLARELVTLLERISA